MLLGAALDRAGIKAIFATGLGCHPALQGFILGNEVTFMESSTPATLASYHSWLQKHYHQSIDKLNVAWGTKFASFDEVPGQPVKPVVVTGGVEAAQWWDWNSFNNWRVTAMYFPSIKAVPRAPIPVFAGISEMDTVVYHTSLDCF